MTTFYLIRHGKHDYDAVKDKNFIGHGLELAPLTEEGVQQAIECCNDERLKDCDMIISSPYTRTMQTSAILSKNLNIDFRVEVDLREHELDLTYRVKSFDELKQIAIEEQKYNGLENPSGTYNWETRASVRERVMDVLKRYINYKKVIVVTHGMVIHCMTEKVGIQNCSIHEIRID
ncbi:MAG TPA: histidine phosphatase family protein [Clostridia bacterium]|nr:histidine phosphatase family protein [Clostridia bacterium]